NNEEIIAELVLQVKGFSEKYQSRVTWEIKDKEQYLISVVSISGPFKYLKNTWKFNGESGEITGKNIEKTTLEFSIDFKIKSLILDKLIDSFFTKATERMINAFEKRAAMLHPSLN